MLSACGTTRAHRQLMRVHVYIGVFAAISLPLIAQSVTTPRTLRPASTEATIHLDANLVLVPVTVTESSGKIIPGLNKNDFLITEEKTPQEIVSFSHEYASVSVGIVLDLSGSMSNKIAEARTAVREFLKHLETGDEVLLVTFSDRAEQRTGFASDDSAVLDELLFARPKGSTALFDAVGLAVQLMRNARNDRRVLLVVSDGGDNHSRLTERQLRRILEETEIQIHALGIHDRPSGMHEASGPQILEDFAKMTGGEHHMVDDASKLPDLAAKMGLLLHDRYVLGYRPTPAGMSGKWRKIRVKVPGAPRLSQIYARAGYRMP